MKTHQIHSHKISEEIHFPCGKDSENKRLSEAQMLAAKVMQ